jgi:two-component system KDP operon response regulator KdpE
MKLLVIDDDEAMTELLKILLSSIADEVLVSNSGTEAIQIIRNNRFDVVILDIMMPDMNGCDVCRKIRDFENVPILILSALDNPGLIAEALDAGADDYLIKPVTQNMLSAHVNKLLRRKPLAVNQVAVLNLNSSN